MGIWFALGNSSVVFVLVATLAFGCGRSQPAFTTRVRRHTGRALRTGVSGTFLILFEVSNLGSLTKSGGYTGECATVSSKSRNWSGNSMTEGC
ncbi:MAG TPA: hypothetical protein VJ777_07555 [Mycobacterium sp.]|nr:hypothetical protein [Mycobacterium sp.]